MSLAELVSVTSNAVKSLSESKKTNNVDAQDGDKLTAVSQNGCPKGLSTRPPSKSLKEKPSTKESDSDVSRSSGHLPKNSDGEMSENVTIIEIRSVNEHVGNSRASSSREDRTVAAVGLSQSQKDSKGFKQAHREIKAVSQDLVWSSKKRKEGDENVVSTDLSDSSNGQPEIIDVHERIIAITTGMSGSEEGSMQSEADAIQEQNSNDDYFRTHPPKAKSKSLKQGIQDKGRAQVSMNKEFDDIFISQFELTEKQRSLKQALAKRSETNNKPKKKFVQSKIIQSKVASEDDTDQDSHKLTKTMAQPTADPAIAAAVAASAAVAATQPFLKVQHELESKIQLLLSQLSELKEKKSAPAGVRPSESEERIQWLEKQMAELNERRMEHLENLQQRQLQMQAQLLYMSRSRTRSPGSHVAPLARQPPPSRIPQVITKQRSQAALQPGQPPVYKTQPVTEAHGQPYHRQPYYNPDTLSKQFNYLNEVRELQGSHLDTPAPRDKVPKPTPYSLPEQTANGLGFLEELLSNRDKATQDSTFSVRGGYSSPGAMQAIDRNNSARGKRSAKSPVDKARQLVDKLSNLEQETAQSVWGPKDSRLSQNAPMEDIGPAPIERYLTYPHKEGSPYPKLHQHSRERKSQELKLDNLMLAKNVLKNLELTRETLEKNIEHVIRSRRDMNVFTTTFGESDEGSVAEQLRIEKLVNKKISAMQPDVQREVLRGLAQEEADKLEAQTQEARLKATAKKTTVKSGNARPGLVKTQAESSARLAFNKPVVSAAAVVPSRGKENTGSRVKPPPKPAVIRDEKTLARTYGKPEYQRGRTTIRDPYLHFKNPKTGRAARPTPVNESFVSGDGRSRSPKGRQVQGQATSPPPRQFYFSPTRGYIPLSATDHAPVSGHLIPMAIPLGEPRMEPGVRRSAALLNSPLNPITSTPVPVTAATNVAMVSFPVEDRRTKKGRQPELATQVLPPIDIDSISPSSSQRSDIQIKSPKHDNVTFMYDTHDADVDLDKTLIEENSEMEQSGEGINLPGYVPPYSQYSGPEFPPSTNTQKVDWTAGEGQGRPTTLFSDVIAEDLRQRDILESNAIHWLEQELMAHVLSQVMAPLQRPHQTDTKVELDKSDDTDQEESLMVADMIGQGGMQLFIDAGQPVDNALVQALVKEVLQEKINSMLAQRSAEVDIQGGRVKDAFDEAMEANDKELESCPPRVPTPEPTPKASPVASPRRVQPKPLTGLTTPPLSPPAAGFRMRPPEFEPEPGPKIQASPEPVPADKESDSELSVSIDISEELRRVADKGKSVEQEEPVIEGHDVATPPMSPVATPPKSPDPPPRHSTPPVSPVTFVKPDVEEEPMQRRTVVVEEEAEEDKEEEEDDIDRVELDQPKPLLLSVAVGRDGPMTIEMSTSPGPKSPSPKHKPPVSSPEPSSSETDSSLTETVNDVISDGQWLLSEGQVIGLPLNEAKRQEFLHKGYQYVGDVSTASTLRDTEDLALDETDYPKSEGEILLSGLPAPESDPMLELLAQMQKNPFQISQRDIPGPQIRQILSGPQPREVMYNTGRSLGEMSVGQVPPSKVAMEVRNGNRKTGRKSPSNSLERSVEEHERVMGSRRPGVELHSRTPSPTVQRYEQSSRSPSPDHRSRPSTTTDRRNRPTRTSRSPSPQKLPQGGPKGRPQRQMQYQPVLSEGAPLPTRGKTPAYGRRSSDSRISQSSDLGTRMSRSSYPSESLSRSAESPILRRSGDGALTSSLKSRQSGVKKSVEFDLTGTYDKSNRWESPVPTGTYDKSSRWESPVPTSDPSQSLGLNYTLDDDSYDETELRKIVQNGGSRPGPYRMSVTLPSTADEAESDISEIDLSNNGFQ